MQHTAQVVDQQVVHRFFRKLIDFVNFRKCACIVDEDIEFPVFLYCHVNACLSIFSNLNVFIINNGFPSIRFDGFHNIFYRIFRQACYYYLSAFTRKFLAYRFANTRSSASDNGHFIL